MVYGVHRTWNSVLVVLLHGRGESWLSTDLARLVVGRGGILCDWTAWRRSSEGPAWTR